LYASRKRYFYRYEEVDVVDDSVKKYPSATVEISSRWLNKWKGLEECVGSKYLEREGKRKPYQYEIKVINVMVQLFSSL